MAEAHADLPTELKFNSPGREHYGKNLGWTVFLVALTAFAWGAEAAARSRVPGLWGSTFYKVHDVYMVLLLPIALLFTALALFGFAGLIWEPVRTWRRWHQLRQPAVVIDASGIRYEARRRPFAVPWLDIERLVLNRYKYKSRIMSDLFLRLTPSASLLRASPIQIPDNRSLKIGLFDDIDVSDQVAVEILQHTAGSRFEIRARDI